MSGKPAGHGTATQQRHTREDHSMASPTPGAPGPDQPPLPLPDSPSDRLPTTVSDTGTLSDAVSYGPSDSPVTVSDRISVRLDSQGKQDLLTIMGAAESQTEAVLFALKVAAGLCAGAWTMGYTPRGKLPVPTAFQVDMGNGRHGEMSIRGGV